MRKTTIAFCIGAMLTISAQTAQADDAAPFGGWHILSADYDQNNLLDVLSYEWEYFTMIDTASGFNGVIGYLVSNPRGRLSDIVQLLPDGGNVAFVGQFGAARPVTEYINFGLDNYEASGTERTFDAWDTATGDFATLTPMPGGGPNGEDAFHLEGGNGTAIWDLVVYQDWDERELDEPRAVVGWDIGSVPGEKWTIDPIWHRTRIQGTVIQRSTGRTINVDGHGYRENAWGRYILTPDGWDTLFFSESAQDLAARGIPEDEGVSIINLSYHKSNLLDFTDISFYDNGELKVYRFRAMDGEISWYHPSWKWDSQSWQCIPQNGVWKYENDDYIIRVNTTVGLENTGTLLSDVTLAVEVYFIDEYFPYYTGTIVRKSDGKTVRTFSGRGAGEFALYKSPSLWPVSSFACTIWGRSLFYHL